MLSHSKHRLKKLYDWVDLQSRLGNFLISMLKLADAKNKDRPDDGALRFGGEPGESTGIGDGWAGAGGRRAGVEALRHDC